MTIEMLERYEREMESWATPLREPELLRQMLAEMLAEWRAHLIWERESRLETY